MRKDNNLLPVQECKRVIHTITGKEGKAFFPSLGVEVVSTHQTLTDRREVKRIRDTILRDYEGSVRDLVMGAFNRQVEEAPTTLKNRDLMDITVVPDIGNFSSEFIKSDLKSLRSYVTSDPTPDIQRTVEFRFPGETDAVPLDQLLEDAIANPIRIRVTFEAKNK